MTVRSNELTVGSARPVSRKYSVRAFYRLAFLAGSALFLVAAIVQPSFAAPINYGDFSGTDVDYLDVTEDANSAGDAPPLFGAPTVTGNSIDFNPVGFAATSAGGGADITDGQLHFGVAAHLDRRINTVTLSEAGDTTLAGLVPVGSMGTVSAVTAVGVLDIHEVDFVGINNISVPFSLTFSPSGGTYFLGTDGGGGPFFHTQWSGSVTLDVNAILIANSIVPPARGATKISINLDNTLIAVSENGTSSVIAKKDFGGLSIVINLPPGTDTGIPEPTSALLAGLGLLAISLGWRRVR